jgi:cytochrome c556
MPAIRSALLAAALLAGTAAADAPRSDAVIGYRQSIFKLILWNYQPMGEMVRGKRAFDAQDFRKRAVRIAFLSQQLGEAFPEGSNSGAMTDALPEIWKQPQDFRAKLGDFQREAKALREAAKTGDQVKVKERFAKTSATCKACHEKYRAE